MQNNGNKKQVKVDLIRVLADVLGDFLKKIWLYLAIGLCAGVVSFLLAKAQYSPVYVSYSTFTVSKHQVVNYHTSIEQNTLSTWISLGAAELCSSDPFKDMVKEEMGYAVSADFPVTFAATSIKNTNLVTIEAQSGDPQLAYDALQTAIRCYLRLEEIGAGGVDLVVTRESGVPKDPSNGSGAKKSAAIGFLLAVFFCLVWLTVKNIMKKTVRTGEELSDLLETELLGSLPVSALQKSKRGEADSGGEKVPPKFEEALRKLRLHVEQEADLDQAKTILVTGALRSEGKTTTAVWLAKALAKRSYNVLLIDGDLRNPAVHTMMGLTSPEPGLTELLAGRCSMEQSLQPYKDSDNLVILPAGKPVENPAALWGSPAAGDLIHRCRKQCDYVIIDAPASAVVSDPGLIAALSDACIYVAREDFAKTDTILEGRDALAGSGCSLLGCVLNT